GDGSLETPFNSVAANAQALAGNTSEVYVKGKISQISEVSTDYGNATYFISDDGTTNGQFEIFRGYYLKGEKFTSEDQIKVGQTVVVKGKLTVYGSTPEMAQGSQIVSIDNNGGETGGIGTVSGNAITFTATDCGIKNGADIGTLVLNDGTKLTFDKGQGEKAPMFYSAGGGALRVYPGNTITVSSSKTIANIAFTCDSVKGTEFTAEGKVNVNPGSFALDGLTMNFTNINATSTVITNAETGSGGKTQMRIKSVVITYAN
ncbi:MAG: hypothetical protein ACOCOW_06335, partial [Prevotella sp.]